MATTPTNQFQTVKTYQKNELAWMLLQFVGINLANKKFKDFQTRTANLGESVSFELAPQAETQAGLVVNAFQETQQRQQTLTCCQSANSNAAYNDTQFLFNAQDYMDSVGESRINVLGALIEQDIFKNITGTQTVITPGRADTGRIIDPKSGPYRFYGDGRTAINSQLQLSQMVANFMDYGMAKSKPCAILPLTKVPPIVNTMLNQFVPGRNETLANTWQLGAFSGFDWYQSNQLPVHYAGNVGKANTTLTLVSVNDPSGNYVTELTFSGASANDSDAIKVGDMFQFNDDVSGQPDMRYLHFNGVGVSSQPVQCRVVNVEGADGSGNVTVRISEALKWTPGLGLTLQNLNNALSPGMEVSFVGDHIAGVLMSGDPLYLAMPKLPQMDPYSTVTTTDPVSGASIRHYWGAGLGNQVRGYIWDVIWGATLVGENSMRICFPL